MRLITLSLVLIFVFSLISPSKISAAEYFVDCQNGNDSQTGSAQATAWRSLEPVHSRPFSAGDTISLKKECSWDTGLRFGTVGNSSGLRLQQSGTAAQPITLQSYGSGQQPKLTNSYNQTPFARIIRIEGDYWQINDIEVADSIEYGIEVAPGAEFTSISGLSVHSVGIGINILGNNTTFENSTISNTKMIRATDSSDPSDNGDDDFGAVAVVIGSSNNTISKNTIKNNIALSPDYGIDGAAVEFFTFGSINSISNNSISQNLIEGNATVTELGSSNGGGISNSTFSNNLMVNNGVIAVVHNGSGAFAANVSNIALEHNSIYEDKASWSHSTLRGNPQLLWFASTPTQQTLQMTNNIVVSTQGTQIASSDAFSHQYNSWYLPNLTQAFGFASSESSLNPHYSNPAGKVFDLAAGSPALDAGTNLGYTFDYYGNARPAAGGADLGAIEKQNQSPSPSSSPNPSVSPQPTPLPTETECERANINQQGTIDLVDYSILSTSFFTQPPTNARADINQDGNVNLIDYSLLTNYFFQDCAAG